MNNHKPTNLLGGSVLFILLSVIFVGLNAHADTDVVTPVDITVPVSCTLSAGGGSYNTTIANGTSGTVVANNITTSCNDTSGYAIYAIGFSNNKYTSDSTGNNNDMISSQNSSYNIQTNGTGTNSNWKMKLESITNATIENSFTSYQNIPATYTKVASYNTIVTTSTIKPTYQIYVGPDQQAGTYTGKVKYTLVHPSTEVPLQPQPATAGCINYFANASSAIGTMGCQSAADNTSVTLLASNFSRAGYGFAGWSDTYDYATNPNANFYGPSETITVPTGTTASGLSLYAVWVKSEGSLQDSSKVSSVCSRLTQSGPSVTRTLNSVSALTDQRDNETYAIAKLADGNCWMIENLRLESTNSDNTTGALAQGYGTSTTYGNFSGLANAESANFSLTAPTVANSATNSLYSSDGSTTVNIGSSGSPAYRMPRYNSDNHQTTSVNRPQNPTSNSANNSTTKASMYSYGNYYTWAAAIANTDYYNTKTTDENGYTPSEAANTSLCPKGWKLPYGRDTGKGATSGGFSNLDIALGGTGAASSSSTTPTGTEMSKSWRAFPNNFLYSGFFDGSSASNRGSNGVYWSSTAYSSSGSYFQYLGSSNVYPGTDSSNKYYGSSIRCIAGS